MLALSILCFIVSFLHQKGWKTTKREACDLWNSEIQIVRINHRTEQKSMKNHLDQTQSEKNL